MEIQTLSSALVTDCIRCKMEFSPEMLFLVPLLLVVEDIEDDTVLDRLPLIQDCEVTGTEGSFLPLLSRMDFSG